MLGMGLTLRLDDFRRVTHTPKWVMTGLFLQFTVMPFLGWFLGKAFNLPPFFAVGLILVSSCPGGTASNVIVFLSRSNLALSVSMTAISTMTAIVITPLLTSSLSGNEIDVDALGLFYSTLKVVLVPVVFGIFLNAKLPRYTQNIQFYSPSVAVILITLIVASIIAQGKEIILGSGVSLILSIMTLHLAGFILGYFLSKILLKNDAVSKTISVEVGMQTPVWELFWPRKTLSTQQWRFLPLFPVWFIPYMEVFSLPCSALKQMGSPLKKGIKATKENHRILNTNSTTNEKIIYEDTTLQSTPIYFSIVGRCCHLSISPTLFAHNPFLSQDEIDWYDVKEIG